MPSRRSGTGPSGASSPAVPPAGGRLNGGHRWDRGLFLKRAPPWTWAAVRPRVLRHDGPDPAALDHVVQGRELTGREDERTDGRELGQREQEGLGGEKEVVARVPQRDPHN